MNKKRLEKEGSKWIKEGIISEEQLQAILNRYVKEDKSYLLVVLSALLVSISIIVFIFSDWSDITNVSRITVMILMMFIFYVSGFYFERKNPGKNQTESPGKKQTYSRSQIIGISLIVLGYVTFGATLLLTLYVYDVQLMSAWPFTVWSLVGIMLYIIVPNRFLFTVALLVTIYGQFHQSLTNATFDYFIFFLFFFVYFHYAYHRGNSIIRYIFSIGLTLQLLLLTINELSNFYWFMLFLLVIYGLSIVLPKDTFRKQMMQVTVLSLLFYKIFETITIQETYTLENLTLQPSFFIFHTIFFFGIAFLLLLINRKELITLLLFIPLFFLPIAYLFIIISLFLYSIYWMIYGFQKDDNNKMILGIFSFLLSVFTVIVQYAWETINKSLFFLIAGLILFGISVLLERRRRKEEGDTNR